MLLLLFVPWMQVSAIYDYCADAFPLGASAVSASVARATEATSDDNDLAFSTMTWIRFSGILAAHIPSTARADTTTVLYAEEFLLGGRNSSTNTSLLGTFGDNDSSETSLSGVVCTILRLPVIKVVTIGGLFLAAIIAMVYRTIVIIAMVRWCWNRVSNTIRRIYVIQQLKRRLRELEPRLLQHQQLEQQLRQKFLQQLLQEQQLEQQLQQLLLLQQQQQQLQQQQQQLEQQRLLLQQQQPEQQLRQNLLLLLQQQQQSEATMAATAAAA